MRGETTRLAFLALAAAMANGLNEAGFNTKAHTGASGFYNPSRSQPVKNKLNRKRYN